MGCTSSIVAIQKVQIQQLQVKKETALIQVIANSQIIEQQQVQPVVEEDADAQMMNTKIKKQKQKIQFLQQSQHFMKQSVEISNYVHQAILNLTYNPLLHDQAYYKLIGMNKKTLEKKQNRINYLSKREQKAQQDLKKQREKRIQKTKSEIINYRFSVKERRKKELNKENRDKQSFAQKMSKAQLQLFDSQEIIH